MGQKPDSPVLQTATRSKVDVVVQEYMDTLLSELFPEVKAETATATPDVEVQIQTESETQLNNLSPVEIQAPVKTEVAVETAIETPVETAIETGIEVAIEAATETIADQVVETVVETQQLADTDVEIDVEQQQKAPVVIRYEDAPDWAQEPFEVLLFDVCGLKLGVPMESLGRIIKIEEELHHIIGKPGWFLGAYDESEQRLYVVDTAKYIMPEKNLDMSELGFNYIIQLQRSQWTLASKVVETTVRVMPDQVKWRSQQGKRPWLAGTIIDHMCALIHVDSLIELLESEVKDIPS